MPRHQHEEEEGQDVTAHSGHPGNPHPGAHTEPQSDDDGGDEVEAHGPHPASPHPA